jgi:hypothetical protein
MARLKQVAPVMSEGARTVSALRRLRDLMLKVAARNRKKKMCEEAIEGAIATAERDESFALSDTALELAKDIGVDPKEALAQVSLYRYLQFVGMSTTAPPLSWGRLEEGKVEMAKVVVLFDSHFHLMRKTGGKGVTAFVKAVHAKEDEVVRESEVVDLIKYADSYDLLAEALAERGHPRDGRHAFPTTRFPKLSPVTRKVKDSRTLAILTAAAMEAGEKPPISPEDARNGLKSYKPRSRGEREKWGWLAGNGFLFPRHTIFVLVQTFFSITPILTIHTKLCSHNKIPVL